MTSEQIRQKFLEFFKRNGHATVASSSLVPSDPSVLLTTAGMQQFKKYYTGELDAQADFGSKSTASIQKCFRTGDIEEVGDNTHLTFFEMLGNFSFGGYFKKEAIHFAYRLLTEELGINPARMYVTVFTGNAAVPFDAESYDIWHKEIGIPAERIRRFGMEDNFWGPTGNEGPCGPTTEIYVAPTEELAKQGKGVEVWNVVFNQYYSNVSKESLIAGKGELKPLPFPGIDTGAGFERLTTVLQGVENIYQTDLFTGILSAISETAPQLPEKEKKVIADHVRASVFLIADGVRPANKEAGYILRRLIRRILAYKVRYDIHGGLFEQLVPVVVKKFSGTYPEIAKPEIMAVLMEEQEKFEKVVANGLKELKKHQTLSVEEAFSINSTFGLNFELMKEMAPEVLKEVSVSDFEKEFKKHQEISRAGAEKKFGGHGLLLDTGELKAANEEELKKVTRLHTATHLTQQALRMVLGQEVHQAGSDITAERMRFDFSFPRKLTPEEIKKVEDIVNGVVDKDLPVGFVEMAKEDAEKTGALYFFKQKYPAKVKVYYVGHSIPESFSKEFCGGPHVDHTAIIGKFKIVKEEAVGAGVRRIRATVE